MQEWAKLLSPTSFGSQFTSSFLCQWYGPLEYATNMESPRLDQGVQRSEKCRSNMSVGNILVQKNQGQPGGRTLLRMRLLHQGLPQRYLKRHWYMVAFQWWPVCWSDMVEEVNYGIPQWLPNTRPKTYIDSHLRLCNLISWWCCTHLLILLYYIYVVREIAAGPAELSLKDAEWDHSKFQVWKAIDRKICDGEWIWFHS